MSSIRDIDHGYKALVGRVFDIGRPVVQAGIFAAEGDKPDGPLEGAPTVADVATWNEFGLGVPERSFLRGYFDENRDRLREMLRVLARAVITGKLTKDQALEQFALKVKGEIQARISDGIPPANAPSTIAEKGGVDAPLIDTGQLRSSITAKVVR